MKTSEQVWKDFTREKVIRRMYKERTDINNESNLRLAVTIALNEGIMFERKRIIKVLKPLECKFCKVIHTISDDGKTPDAIHKDFDLKQLSGTEKDENQHQAERDSNKAVDVGSYPSEMPEKT